MTWYAAVQLLMQYELSPRANIIAEQNRAIREARRPTTAPDPGGENE